MNDWQAIVATIEERRADRSAVLDMMIAVRDRYEADYVIPDPSGLSDEPTPALTPALIAQAIDLPALRAASVLPAVYTAALDAGAPNGRGSIGYAQKRRGAVMAAWWDSKIPLLLRRAFRHMRAYDVACFVVDPDSHTKMPKIHLRDPLHAYPEPKVPEDVSLPRDCGFVYGKSASWIRARYPRARMEFGGPVPERSGVGGPDLWDMVEWLDEEDIVIGLLGPRLDMRRGYTHGRETGPVSQDFELLRYPNRAGCCPVVCPQTVTLSQVASQVAKIIGHVDLSAQIMGLEIKAIQKGIWPDRFALGAAPGLPPSVVGGHWKEGTTGEINLLENVREIGELRGTPDPAAAQMIDRLERNARLNTGLVPQLGGETYGALRTGRGIDTLTSIALDPATQELQELMQFSLEAVNEALLRTYTGYYGAKKYHLFFGLGGTGSYVEFTPDTHLAEDHHTKVSYAIAGADKQGTTIQLGQMMGAHIISAETARHKHPDVDDPEMEKQRIVEEALDEAAMTGILQRVATPDSPGSLTPVDVAKMRKLVREGKTLDEAVLAVDEERSRLQAEQAAGAATPEQMQPGLAGPQEAAPMPGPEGIEGPSSDLENFRSLVGALGQGGGA